MSHTFTIEEDERQALLLALALLVLQRPGWDLVCTTIAQKLDNPDLAMYRAFQEYNRDVVGPTGPGAPA